MDQHLVTYIQNGWADAANQGPENSDIHIHGHIVSFDYYIKGTKKWTYNFLLQTSRQGKNWAWKNVQIPRV